MNCGQGGGCGGGGLQGPPPVVLRPCKPQQQGQMNVFQLPPVNVVCQIPPLKDDQQCGPRQGGMQQNRMGGMPQNIQMGGMPQNMQMGGMPQNMQMGGMPQNMMQMGGMPQNIRMGGMPQNMQMGGMPQNMMQMGGMPQNMMQMGGMPQNMMQMGGMPQENIMQIRGIPLGMPQDMFQQMGGNGMNQMNYQPMGCSDEGEEVSCPCFPPSAPTCCMPINFSCPSPCPAQQEGGCPGGKSGRREKRFPQCNFLKPTIDTRIYRDCEAMCISYAGHIPGEQFIHGRNLPTTTTFAMRRLLTFTPYEFVDPDGKCSTCTYP